MPRRPKVSTKQVLLRMDNVGPSGMIDLTSLDLTAVDIGNDEIRASFKKYAAFSRENSAKYGMPYINLTGSDISGLDFSGMDLSNVIFSGVTAVGTIFAACTMSDTQFDLACADDADFSRADLYHTKFYMTSIHGANFTDAKMKFVHGFGGPQEVVERLGVAGSIKNASLPPAIDGLREDIEKAIRMNEKRNKDRRGSKFGMGRKTPEAPPPSVITKPKPNTDDSGFSDI